MSKQEKPANFISAKKLRVIEKACRQVLNLRVGPGLKYTPSDNNAVLELVKTEEEGGGVPEGYVETEVILCQNGSPVAGTILFKEDA